MLITSMRQVVAVAAAATGFALAGCASVRQPGTTGAEATAAVPDSSTATETSPAPIGATDIAAVRALAWRLSTRHGARVQVVRAHGGDVWAKFYPDWTDYGGTESRMKSVDVLVVRSTDHVPLGQESETPGMTPAPIGVRSVIIDPVTGYELTWSDAGMDQTEKFDNTIFGPTIDITLP